MSDIANRIIDRMIGGSDQVELAAAQALWGQTVFQANTAIQRAITTGQDQTSSAISKLIAAGWDKDDPYIIWLQESQQQGFQSMQKLQDRMLDLQQPRSNGLFA